ncbi:polysaccharide pyruvyl transferase family protein [Microbacterium sp. 179-B 1A2 NHS]|uniref:polysaccharide pyruvyl transferase family protein n=1 Tax=Microbacterium sp. 179-B 1A2 NHS TaxID=3142383 RepID=UPI00399F353E
MNMIFVNPAGQRDNLGDSVLRRAYLDALRARGELHVLVGRDADYASGLGLQPADVTYTSRLRWLIRACSFAIRGRLTFAANAGEFVGTRAEQIKASWQIGIATLARITGGEVIVAGVSVRPGSSLSKTPLGQLARVASVLTWRDRASRETCGRGIVQPDWAFGITSNERADNRNRLLVSVRADREPLSHEFISSLRRYATDHSLEVCAVVQVRHDSARAAQLADQLGGKLFDWPAHRTHAEHERALRSLYQSSRVVLSDRIHVLIIALTEGCVPIGIDTGRPAKLRNTFDHVFQLEIVDGQSPLSALSVNAVLTREAEYAKAVTIAASDLDEVAAIIARPTGPIPPDSSTET